MFHSVNTFKNEIGVDPFAARTMTLVVLLRLRYIFSRVQPAPAEREHFKRYLFLHQLWLSVMDCSCLQCTVLGLSCASVFNESVGQWVVSRGPDGDH